MNFATDVYFLSFVIRQLMLACFIAALFLLDNGRMSYCSHELHCKSLTGMCYCRTQLQFALLTLILHSKHVLLRRTEPFAVFFLQPLSDNFPWMAN